MRHKLYQRESGMALIIVLLIVMAIAMMASSYVLSSRRDIRTTQVIKTQASKNADIEKYLNLSKFWLMHPEDKKRWVADGRLYQIQTQNEIIRIQITSETGKCDINNASEDLLRAILKVATPDRKLQQQLVDRLIDWRDEDDERLDFGAESADYLRRKFNYIPNNQAFESVDDLLMVMDFDASILDKIRPYITVYSQQADINYHNASIDMLRLLKQDFSQRHIQDLELDKELDLKLNPYPLSNENLDESLSSIEPDQVYNVIIEIKTIDNIRYSLETYLKTQAEDSVFWPFQTLDWKTNQLKTSLFADQPKSAIFELSNEFTN